MTENFENIKHSQEDVKFFHELAEKEGLRETEEYLIIPKKKEDGSMSEIHIPKARKVPVGSDADNIEWIKVEERIKQLKEREE